MSSTPHHKFWPKRLSHTIEVPATALTANLSASAKAYPDKTALVFLDRATRYAELADQVGRLAGALCQLGVRAGDRVLLNMQNCPQLVVAHFAILQANAVVVPVNPMNRKEELKHYIADAGARIALTTGDLAAELAEASNELDAPTGLAHLVVTAFTDAFTATEAVKQQMPESWKSWLLKHHPMPALVAGTVHAWNELLRVDATAPPPKACADDLAVVVYTSGTTGVPKGCMHTHGSIMHNAMASHHWTTATSRTVMLCAIPLFHITGMVTVMHSTIHGGGTLVIMPRWDRDFAAHQISSRKVSHWTNIPTMVIDLMASPDLSRYDLSSLVYVGGGGAAMPEAIAERLLAHHGLRYVEGYGLTETAAPTHYNPPDDPKPQCLGIPFVGVDACVIDAQRQVVAVGETGEIVVRGPSLFSGYWGRPDATAEAFVAIDGKRFFRTGDMGRIDADGFFFLTDRLKRMINASGFKVWPAEVESLMFRHPDIQEACVIGVEDPYRGESVMAIVVPKPGCEASEVEILAWCRDHMAVYKAPRTVRFVETLPRSGSGKVLWRALQESEAEQRRNRATASKETE